MVNFSDCLPLLRTLEKHPSWQVCGDASNAEAWSPPFRRPEALMYRGKTKQLYFLEVGDRVLFLDGRIRGAKSNLKSVEEANESPHCKCSKPLQSQ
jgi:hypothetical protein